MTSLPSSDALALPPEGTPVLATARPDPSLLGARVRSGLAWKVASQGTTQVTRVATTLILAHLLAPSDFGLAGMVLVFGGLIQLFADVGFSASLIQFKTVSEEDCSTAFWTGLLIATALFGASVAAAPAVAGFYHTPQLRWMFVAVASGFVTEALIVTQSSLLWRRMEFRAMEIRVILATVVSTAVGVCSALAGLGAWSLILQGNAFAVTSAVTIWTLSPWKPRFAYSRESLKRMLGFSTNVFFARFLTYGDRNADNLLVGRFLGSTALGIYGLGYSIILMPFGRLVQPLQNVTIPALASLQDDLPRMRAVWLRSVRTTAWMLFPLLAGVIVVCPDFVPVVLGHRWVAAVPVMRILAWVALIQSICAFSGAVYQSRSRAGLLLRMTAFAFGLDLAAFIVGLHWGVQGVAGAYALTNTVVIVPLTIFVVTRLLDASPRIVVAELRGVVEATVMMAAAVLALRRLLELEGLGAGARLATVVAAGAIVYLLMSLWRERRVFRELRVWRFRPVTAAG
ncbi:MAG: lipopolysaccharide biosynthesis protein [Gaiellaceae bacterium]